MSSVCVVLVLCLWCVFLCCVCVFVCMSGDDIVGYSFNMTLHNDIVFICILSTMVALITFCMYDWVCGCYNTNSEI